MVFYSITFLWLYRYLGIIVLWLVCKFASTHTHTHTHTHRMHTLAVDSDGMVYCFGQGSGGQLGVTKTSNITTPKPIVQDWSIVPPRSGGLMVSFRKSCLMMSDSLEEESESSSEGECEKSMEEVTMVIPPEGTSVDPLEVEPMDIEEQQGDHCMWYYWL